MHDIFPIVKWACFVCAKLRHGRLNIESNRSNPPRQLANSFPPAGQSVRGHRSTGESASTNRSVRPRSSVNWSIRAHQTGLSASALNWRIHVPSTGESASANWSVRGCGHLPNPCPASWSVRPRPPTGQSASANRSVAGPRSTGESVSAKWSVRAPAHHPLLPTGESPGPSRRTPIASRRPNRPRAPRHVAAATGESIPAEHTGSRPPVPRPPPERPALPGPLMGRY